MNSAFIVVCMLIAKKQSIILQYLNKYYYNKYDYDNIYYDNILEEINVYR